MASVDWMKIKAGTLRRLAPHYQQDLREKVHHVNRHIDTDMTPYNFSIGAEDFYEACDKMEARVKKLDELYPPLRVKKDRVVAVNMEIVCPPEIAALGMVEASDYFRKVYKSLEDAYGKENCCGGFVHFDEKHTYIDAKTKNERESLWHMTVVVVAEVDEMTTSKRKDKSDPTKTIEVQRRLQGVNGKHFCSRANIKRSNELMEDICHEYGVEWHTGEGKNYETVETLKAKSAKAERELEEQRLAELAAMPVVELKTETVTYQEKVGLMKTEEKKVQKLSEPYKAKELAEQAKAVQRENIKLKKRVEQQDKELQEVKAENSLFHSLVVDLLEAIYYKTISIDKKWLRGWSRRFPFLDREMSGYENHIRWTPRFPEKNVPKPDQRKDRHDPER